MIKAYRENSLPVDSDEMRRIRFAARNNQMYAFPLAPVNIIGIMLHHC